MYTFRVLTNTYLCIQSPNKTQNVTLTPESLPPLCCQSSPLQKQSLFGLFSLQIILPIVEFHMKMESSRIDSFM